MTERGGYPQAGDVLVMVGTKKGTFLFWSDPARRTWQRSEHHLGWMVHALSYDPRHNSIYAATNSAWFGAVVQRSDDGGRTWDHLNEGLDFGEDAFFDVTSFLQTVVRPYVGFNLRTEGTDVFSSIEYNYGHPAQLHVTIVPVPATILLLGSGLIGLVGFRRKFRKK